VGARSCVYKDVSRPRIPSFTEDELLQTYHQTIRPLYAFVSRRVGGDSSLAEDLVQDTWMRALDTWPANGLPDEPLAWLIHVARNTMISHFRRIQPQSIDPAAIDLETAATSPDDGGRAAMVSWGLARLRRRHAELLEAFYFDEKSVKDIARERAVSERAVEGRLRRARAKLKKQLQRVWRPRAARRTSRPEERNPHAGHTRTS
jgi:RNA polymerase sigma-70 factor (ECF subfamily)